MKLLILVLSIIYCGNLYSSARVMPTKVFLDDRARSFKISIKNKAKESKWFSVKSVFYRMKKDGKMSLVKKPKVEERSGMKLIRFSPKRVFLKPEQEQIVRITVRKKSKLEEGEYRSHLYIVEDELQVSASESSKSAGMNLRSRVAVAIPVLYRHGKLRSNISISKISLSKEKAKDLVNLQIDNMGKTFVFGTLEAYFLPEGAVKREKVLFVKGVSSYLPSRNVSYPLNISKLKLSGKGKLELYLREDGLRGGGVLAKGSLDL